MTPEAILDDRHCKAVIHTISVNLQALLKNPLARKSLTIDLNDFDGITLDTIRAISSKDEISHVYEKVSVMKSTGIHIEMNAWWLEGNLLIKAKELCNHGEIELMYASFGLLPDDARKTIAFARLLNMYPILINSQVSCGDMKRFARQILIHSNVDKDFNRLLTNCSTPTVISSSSIGKGIVIGSVVPDTSVSESELIGEFENMSMEALASVSVPESELADMSHMSELTENQLDELDRLLD